MENKFEGFLLKEYENIATAHFESQKQLATFFRYYMIFFSVPFIVLSVIEKNQTNTWLTIEIFAYILIGLAVVGIFFYWFAMEIKYEAVLYARTVNGIRNYFYKELNNPDLEKTIRTLPTDINKPDYESCTNPVLNIIILVNSLYLVLAFIYLKLFSTGGKTIVILLFIALHLTLNWFVTSRQKVIYPTK